MDGALPRLTDCIQTNVQRPPTSGPAPRTPRSRIAGARQIGTTLARFTKLIACGGQPVHRTSLSAAQFINLGFGLLNVLEDLGHESLEIPRVDAPAPRASAADLAGMQETGVYKEIIKIPGKEIIKIPGSFLPRPAPLPKAGNPPDLSSFCSALVRVPRSCFPRRGRP